MATTSPPLSRRIRLAFRERRLTINLEHAVRLRELEDAAEFLEMIEHPSPAMLVELPALRDSIIEQVRAILGEEAI
jgi:hypothetical protein